MPYDEYKNKPLDALFIYAIKHGERVPVADIQVKIKSITATNIKQKNNPSKDKVLYTSKTTEGYTKKRKIQNIWRNASHLWL